MLDHIAVGGLFVFAASQVGTPGPANMVLLAAGARFGALQALPFLAGVILGKQLVIWLVGFGIMVVLAEYPLVFTTLKWVALGYILWLAWRIARMRLDARGDGTRPGFVSGLWVHPLNPKAWAMVTAGFTGFVTPGAPVLTTTLQVGVIFLMVQCIAHPIWTIFGAQIARRLAGTRAETYLMMTLAGLTVASVLYALWKGGIA